MPELKNSSVSTGPLKIAGKKPYQVDLPELMAVCEINYWRLRKLLLPVFSVMEENEEYTFTLPGAECNSQRRFVLHIKERCPYTTTLSFIELHSDISQDDVVHQRWGISPKLDIRVYHDAKTAEVIAFQGRRHFQGRYAYPNPQMHQPDEKLQLNILLADWLNHCLQYGYCCEY